MVVQRMKLTWEWNARHRQVYSRELVFVSRLIGSQLSMYDRHVDTYIRELNGPSENISMQNTSTYNCR